MEIFNVDGSQFIKLNVTRQEIVKTIVEQLFILL